MTDNDFIFQEYDLNIIKENVLMLMKANNITQTTLAEAIGMQQSAISKALNKNNSSSFTISQIVNIANYFCVSLDNLLGVKPQKKNYNDVTLADVLEKLFELDDMLEFDIGEYFTEIPHDKRYSISYELRDYAYKLNYPDNTIIVPGLYSKNFVLIKILLQWSQIKKLQTTNISNHLIQLWKEDVINTSRHRFKEFDFMTPEELAEADENDAYTHFE